MTNLVMKELSELLSDEGLDNLNNFSELFHLLENKSSESNTCGRSTEGNDQRNFHHVIDKRNARERKRVENVNDAFKRLRSHIPYENRKKRLSKVKTLQTAMRYINYLTDLLHTADHVNEGDMTSAYVNEAVTSHSKYGCGQTTDDLANGLTSYGLDTGYVVSGTLYNVSIYFYRNESLIR